MVAAIPAALSEAWLEGLGGTDGRGYVHRTDLRILARHELGWQDGLLVIATERSVVWALRKDETTDRVWYEGSAATARFRDDPNRFEWSIAHESTQEFLTAFDRYACLWDQDNLLCASHRSP